MTTSTDVYSLGVTLHELLTASRPYRVTDRSPAGLERIVCDQDPTLPCIAMAATTGRRNELSRRLLGDLDTIVLKALRKEPDARYASVEELAEDIPPGHKQ